MTPIAASSVPPRLAVLGTGAMAGALLAGLLRTGFPAGNVRATVRGAGHAADLAARLGVAAVAVADDPEANRKAAAGAEVVVVGLVPGLVSEVLDEIGPVLRPDAVVVSLSGMVTTDAMARHLPAGTAVVRALGNPSAQVGQGPWAVTAGPSCDADRLRAVVGLLSSTGRVWQVPEAQQATVGELFSTGLAALFSLAESLVAVGESRGLDRASAVGLVGQLVAGVGASLVPASPGAPVPDPRELLAEAATPGGTTAVAAARIARSDPGRVVAEAAAAAGVRHREIEASLA